MVGLYRLSLAGVGVIPESAFPANFGGFYVLCVFSCFGVLLFGWCGLLLV